MNSSNVCLITFLFHKGFIIPLSNLEKILIKSTPNACSIQVCFEDLLTANEKKMKKYKIIQKKESNLLLRIIRFFQIQFRISWKIIKLSRKTDSFLFFAGQWGLISIITSKLLGKKIIWAMPSFFPKMLEYDKNAPSFSKYYIYVYKLSLYLVDNIILYSPNLVNEWGLTKYKNKILFAHEHFLNFEKFKIKTPISKRKYSIGYIGRLSEEKGILNFLKTIKLLNIQNKELKIVIIGTGPLKRKTVQYLKDNNLTKITRLIDWVDHDELEIYLDQIKLLIIPSYTEGLPNIMLESMGCGTIVLATPVGSIPDIISDGKNGFLIKKNSPELIEKDINKVLNLSNTNLERISHNAHLYVYKKFDFKSTLENWSKIINK